MTGTTSLMPIGEALDYAERCRAEGRLMEAEAICKQILAAQPDLAAAHHLAGLIAHQAGQLADAIAHVQRATALAPDVALFRANLGEMFRLSGQPKKAVDEGRRATGLDPAMPAAWSNLGAAHYELKDFEIGGACATEGDRGQSSVRAGALQSRQRLLWSEGLPERHRRLSDGGRARRRLRRRLGQSRHGAAPQWRLRGSFRLPTPRHRPHARPRQCARGPWHPAADARRFRRRARRI